MAPVRFCSSILRLVKEVISLGLNQIYNQHILYHSDFIYLDINYHQKYILDWMRILGLMKILFLTAHLPYPPFSGGRRREFELISRLSRSFEIHLISITKSWRTDSMYINDLLQYCRSVNLFEAAPPTNKQQQYALYPHQMKKHVSEEASS